MCRLAPVDRAIGQTALNLNLNMVASPNGVRFVHDGDGSSYGEAGPDGSADIERLFLDCFSENSLAAEATQFDGGSDYAPFPEAGIPAGGLFAGDVGTKTTEQVRSYGGLAGEDHKALILVGNFERLRAATETPRTALGRR